MLSYAQFLSWLNKHEQIFFQEVAVMFDVLIDNERENCIGDQSAFIKKTIEWLEPFIAIIYQFLVIK